MKTCPVIYENDEILIVNKASGVAVQGGSGVSHPLDDALSEQLGYRIHLVHRLDKETSGLLVIAKNPAAAKKWTALIGGKQVKKEYTAVCFNVPVIDGKKLLPAQSATIREALEKDGKKQDAVTHVTLMRTWTFPAGDGPEASPSLTFSLVRLVLGTGRMHQIRIHLSHAGSPLVGDDRHGNFALNKAARKLCGAKLLMLAATRLTVPGLMSDGSAARFEVPLPAHMASLVEQSGKSI
ncbi:MAG: RluA family pseudouridine synthase [Treponema sp.]|nr:RluA family pseudouridine synthase [Treponema sp.]